MGGAVSYERGTPVGWPAGDTVPCVLQKSLQTWVRHSGDSAHVGAIGLALEPLA